MADSNAGYEYKLYRYVPSIPAGTIMAVVFGLLAIACLYRIVRHGAYFFISFLVGLLCMYLQTGVCRDWHWLTIISACS